MYYAERRLPQRPSKSRRGKLFLALTMILVLVLAAAYVVSSHHDGRVVASRTTTTTTTRPKNVTATTAETPAANPCASNTLPKLALVSISQRHLWACAGTSVAYSSAVVTGMENLAADLTPTGTYHVYGKQTNLYLNGSDSTGSWHDYVYYWMPFLDNQYGAYGFHDATWRPADAFGNISPYASNASHGCVELPLATAKWLYAWVVIGTTVTIET